MNVRCRIEQRTITKDATTGSEVLAWSLKGVRRCNIQDAVPSRSESVNQELETARQTVRWRLGYCTDIDSTMRVIINRPLPVVYQIIAGPSVLGDKEAVEFMLERNTVENAA